MSSSVRLTLVVILVLFGVAGAYYAFFGNAPQPAEADGGGSPSAPRTSLKQDDSSSKSGRLSPNDGREGASRTPKLSSGDDKPVFTLPGRDGRTGGPTPVPNDEPKVTGVTPVPPVDGSTHVSLESGKGDESAPPTATEPEGAGHGSATQPTSNSGRKPDDDMPNVKPPATTEPTATTPVNPVKPDNAKRPAEPDKPAPNPNVKSPPRPPAYTDYAVKSGDTMTSIAEEWFGDANKWDLISKANPLVDPQRLKIGQVLRLPPKESQREPIEPVRGTNDVSYTVRSGDTLSRIAEAYYGDKAKWQLIYDANRSVIGSDPAELKVGMKLTIPPAPAPARR